MVRFGVLALVASCVSSNSVVCDDGSICPRGTVCDPHGLCVDPSQLAACDGKPELADCMVGTLAGHCQDGVCLTPVCGDGFVELGEQCDDGNTLAKDGCSADCTSTESCGNNVVDLDFGETCDDGNHLDHDGCSSTCQTEQPHWILRTLTMQNRSSAGFAYDSTRDRIVMMGGTPSSLSVFSDTWEWDGSEWTQIPTPVSPDARANAMMAYDAARKVTVLYGGTGGFSGYSDTWLWNGSTWRLAHPTTGPGPRIGAGIAYDSRRQRVVLFGGVSEDAMGAQVYPADTWEWDGTDWAKQSPAHSPPPRFASAMTYDPLRGRVVLTGGGVPASPLLSDTWEYDGTDWVQRNNSAPALWRTVLTYDPLTHRSLLFGGNATSLSAWDGNAWSTVTTSGGGPDPRELEVFVATKTRVVLFGGDRAAAGQTNDTWLLTNNAWSQPTEPGPRVAAMFERDPLRLEEILYGGITQNAPTTRTGATWGHAQTGWSLRANTPSARSRGCITYDYAHHVIVMFGGELPALSNETWIWDGAGWMQKFPTTVPLARSAPACAFDGQHVTMVGGINAGNGEIGDAWSWDGTNWTPITLPPGFIGRGAAAAGYDPKHHHMALFSGFSPDAMQLPGDTWLYDGSTWTQIATDGFRPSARFGAMFAWNPARQTLVLSGGNTPLDQIDAFELDDREWRFIGATNPPPMRQFHGSATSLAGDGITIYGGQDPASSAILSDRWDLRWDSSSSTDACNGKDGDGDGLAKCDDPDCWWVCAPLCPPNTTCDPSAPKCGDGTCTAPREDCHNCAADCLCGAPVCGDGYCDPGETCPGDCP